MRVLNFNTPALPLHLYGAYTKKYDIDVWLRLFLGLSMQKIDRRLGRNKELCTCRYVYFI